MRPRGDINKALGINKTSLTSYIENEWKLQGRYTLQVVEEPRRIAEKSPSNFNYEWTEAVKPFLKVVWSRTEGKKLYAGKAVR